ncbi:hypothetical protein N0B31_13425 [Salinirubellus salinus]|uniref:Fibronectin type III domain-containing protein n=1 Tax=Salinirubellus salinus TaxID=1364945 RepID=A0A9E7R017_9EURY|nr:hypothetical protein [Salinirubellus salinus]UWM53142.1 hypothetical protein N0B31_13425 [Salinirubellus salinus]
MARNSKLFAVTMASLLVFVAFTPGALAASAANAAANTSVDVSTEAATDVTVDSATLNGNVTELNGSENASLAFQYWAADDSVNKTTVEAGNLSSEGAFSADVGDLSPDTTYVYVATAGAGNAAAVGAEQEFTTLETLDVSVETDGAVNVTATNATFEGDLTDVQGAENASVSFRMYEEGQRNTTNVLTLGEQSEGNFSADVSELSPNTAYVVVAQAEAERGNESEDATGESVNFTTDDATQPLGVETANASDVTNTSASLNGDLTGLNGSDNASVSFTYWVSGDAANTTTTTAVELDAPGSFSAAVDGLAGNTTYVYAATAETGDESVAGENVTFTTEADVLPLGVETDDATEVANASATLNGDLTGLNGSDSAAVAFEYWAVNGSESATTVDAGNLSDAGTFDAGVSGLQNNTTYVYVATAEVGNAAVTGEEETFTTGAAEEEGFVPPNGPFGQQVVAFVDYLRNSEDAEERNLGQSISDWVTANNPGADNRPDHAGPPADKGPSADKERGPPEDKERGPPEDKERGPPADRGPDEDDDDAAPEDDEEEADDSDDDEEDDDSDDDEEDDKGGPPEHAGPK